jgi:hypothetical protein
MARFKGKAFDPELFDKQRKSAHQYLNTLLIKEVRVQGWDAGIEKNLLQQAEKLFDMNGSGMPDKVLNGEPLLTLVQRFALVVVTFHLHGLPAQKQPWFASAAVSAAEKYRP